MTNRPGEQLPPFISGQQLRFEAVDQLQGAMRGKPLDKVEGAVEPELTTEGIHPLIGKATSNGFRSEANALSLQVRTAATADDDILEERRIERQYARCL